MTTHRFFATILIASSLLFACGDDSTASDASADSAAADSASGDSAPADASAGDGAVMCIALGETCDGTVPCCPPNGCAGGMCGAPRGDAGADAAGGDGG